MNSPSDFYQTLKNTFDVLYEEGAESSKIMNVGLHCRIVGRPSRAAALRDFLEYATGFPDVWFARRVRDSALVAGEVSTQPVGLSSYSSHVPVFEGAAGLWTFGLPPATLIAGKFLFHEC